MLALFLTVVVIGVVAAVAIAVAQSLARKRMSEAVEGVDDFTPNYRYMSQDGSSGIAIDERRRKLCLIRPSGKMRFLAFSEVLGAEVLQIGGGTKGAITGIVGPVAVTGMTRSKVARVDLKITINDLSEPSFLVNFQNAKGKAGGIINSVAVKQASEWAARLNVLIASGQSGSGGSGKQLASIADELEKLGDLHARGLLSRDEFDVQKGRLLAP